MKILICAATPMEMRTVEHSSHEIQYLVTGVGMSQTSYRLGKYLVNNRPDFAIQIGIAGSYQIQMHIGKVLLIRQDCFADLGARDANHTFLHLSEMLPSRDPNPFEQQVIKPNFERAWLEWPWANAITVNSVRGSQSEIKETELRFRPDLESMEGASFYAICMTEEIQCIQMRAISNLVEPRNKKNWNIPLAIKNLHASLDQLITSIG